MAEKIRQVVHYTALIPNRAGAGARVLGALRDAGVNLIALWGYPYRAKNARIEFIPENGAKFAAAAKRAGLKLSKKQTAIFISGNDRPGAVATVLEKLAAAGINVEAAQAVCGGAGRYGAIVYLSPAATRKAVKVLGAA
jgi:prephenate dehydratase